MFEVRIPEVQVAFCQCNTMLCSNLSGKTLISVASAREVHRRHFFLSFSWPVPLFSRTPRSPRWWAGTWWNDSIKDNHWLADYKELLLIRLATVERGCRCGKVSEPRPWDFEHLRQRTCGIRKKSGKNFGSRVLTTFIVAREKCVYYLLSVLYYTVLFDWRREWEYRCVTVSRNIWHYVCCQRAYSIALAIRVRHSVRFERMVNTETYRGKTFFFPFRLFSRYVLTLFQKVGN